MEPLYSTTSTMLSMDPIFVHHARNQYFSGVLYVGVYVGRLQAAEPHPLVHLPGGIPYLGDAYIRLYNILVSVFGEQPYATFTDLFNAVRVRAFESLQNECSVDVHFLPAPLPAVAITPTPATVLTIDSTMPSIPEIAVADTVSVIAPQNTDHLYATVEPVLTDEPCVTYDPFISSVDESIINEPIAGTSRSLADVVMDFDHGSPLSLFNFFDIDEIFDDIDLMLLHASDDLNK